MKNSINLVSVIYLAEYNPDTEIDICLYMEAFAENFNNLTVRLQDYKYREGFGEGCMTFTLSRRLEKQERAEFKSQWETELIQLQFHTQKKLF